MMCVCVCVCVLLRQRGYVKCCDSIYQRGASHSEQHSACGLSGAVTHTVRGDMKCCGDALKKEACWRPASAELYLQVQHFGPF